MEYLFYAVLLFVVWLPGFFIAFGLMNLDSTAPYWSNLEVAKHIVLAAVLSWFFAGYVAYVSLRLVIASRSKR